MSSSIWNRNCTEVHFPPSDLEIKPKDRWFLTGSCFASELAAFLDKRYIQYGESPIGISYNPLSIVQGLQLLTKKGPWNEEGLFFHQGLWKHPLFHGNRNSESREIFCNQLNHDLEKTRNDLRKSRLLVLTLGTSWIYREKGTGLVVNNCHRRDSTLFQRELLSIQRMKESLYKILQTLFRKNPDLDCVISVSPVRHLRDDARENSLSKARLICTAQELSLEMERCYYFPAWEIMMDELRDYRWYGENLKNPSPAALSYIMERFMKWSGSEEILQYLPKAEKLLKLETHRPDPRLPESAKKHQTEVNRLRQELSRAYPHLRRA